MSLGTLFPSMAPPPAAAEPPTTLITAPAPPTAARSSDPDATLADKLYPAMQKALASEQPPPPSAPDPDQKTAERLFDKEPEAFVDVNAPDEVKALREADGARKMYSPQELFKNDLPDEDFLAVVGNVAVDGTPITREQAVQAAGVWREIAADLDLAPADVAALVPILKAAPPSPEVQAQNRVASFKWLEATHGDGAGAAPAAAQQLVARDPRVAALLDRGAGDDPRVVRRIVESALRQVASGRLKVPK